MEVVAIEEGAAGGSGEGEAEGGFAGGGYAHEDEDVGVHDGSLAGGDDLRGEAFEVGGFGEGDEDGVIGALGVL